MARKYVEKSQDRTDNAIDSNTAEAMPVVRTGDDVSSGMWPISMT
jgi:hypothetical protein